MKNIILFTLLILSNVMTAKNVTTKILVKGNCELCKERIENAMDIPGVSFAEWNKETKMLTVRFNDKKISIEEIHAKMSNIGYATNKVTANPQQQAKLDKCCQPKSCDTKKKGCCSK